MASPLSNLRVQAENHAYSEIESLRMSVLGAIGDASSFSGWQGDGLRSKIQAIVESTITTFTASSKTYLQEAWKIGIQRATPDFSKKLENLPPSSVADGTDSGLEVLRAANAHVSAGIAKALRTLLSRASVSSDVTAEDILTSLRDKSSSGFFDSAKQQLAGTLSEEITVMEARAHDLRSKELQAHIALQSSSGSLNKAKGTQRLMPLTIRVWRHKPLGSVGQPRPNHVMMDGKGVVFDHTQGNIPFHLTARDGTVYKTLGPKLPPLPIGETANCGCMVTNSVIWVTAQRKAELIALSKQTGGMDNWKSKS